MSSGGDDLQWPRKVEQVELGVQGEEDINGFLVRNSGRLVCSHLADVSEAGSRVRQSRKGRVGTRAVVDWKA